MPTIHLRYVVCLLLCAIAAPAHAQPASSPTTTLFQNVRIFDGKSATLSAPSHVLVRGNTIETISTQPIPVDRQRGHAHHRRRRTHADAGPDRRSLARDADPGDSGTIVR